MIIRDDLVFFDESALLDRLTSGTECSGRKVVFLVGAPLTAPIDVGAPGVSDVHTVIDLIKGEFCADSGQSQQLNLLLSLTLHVEGV
jgi:hypothetical protein